MTPLEQIKHGIISGDMKAVADGYNRITNDTVAPKVVKPARLPVEKRNTRTRRNNDFDSVDVPEFTEGQQAKKTTDARVEQFVPKRRVNLWSDAKDEKLVDYTEKDREDDIRTRQAPRTQRPPMYKPVKTNCFSCGRSYVVNPVFIIGGEYRCDRCSSGK